jgi:hypothetical protein
MSSLALFLLVGLASAAPANTTSLSPAEASLSSKVAALSTYDWNSYITNTSYNQWGYPVTTQTYVISTSFTPSYKQYGTRSVMVGQPVTTATILLEDSEYSDSEEEDTVVIPTDLPKSDKENIVSLLKSANLAFPATAGDDDVHGDEPTDHHEGMSILLYNLLKQRIKSYDMQQASQLHMLSLNCSNLQPSMPPAASFDININ